MTVLIITALVLGAQHTLAPDHIAAVSVFASRRPSWRLALGMGARWGIGHALTILLLGSALVWSGAQVPATWESAVERLVGVVLIGLGVASIWRAARLTRRGTERDGGHHAQTPAVNGAAHEHEHSALLGIGMLHGVAGTGALVIALPLAAGTSPAHSMVFLASFGIGTVLAMAMFAAVIGALCSRAVRVSLGLERALCIAAGIASMAVGVWWAGAGGA